MFCRVCNKAVLDIYEASHRRRDSRPDRLQKYRTRLNLAAIRQMTSEVGDTPATFVQDAPPSLGRRLISRIRSLFGF